MRDSLRLASVVAAVLLTACGGGEDSAGSSAMSRESATAASGKQVASAASKTAAPTSKTAARLALPGGPQAVIDKRLSKAKGPVDVWVTLDQPSLAAYKSARLEAQGEEMQARQLGSLAQRSARVATPAEQALRSAVLSQRTVVESQQASVLGSLKGMGAKSLGAVHVAHNAVAVRVNAESLQTIAALPGVVKVRPVINYKLALDETVPYVGAAAAQAAGKDGTGVRVAVLDSGIDYTHYNLGGAGTQAAYAAAYGSGNSDPKNTTTDGLFPTSKVIGGYDFVGEAWPNGALAPDPDPIDFEGHGTHVADIIAGRSADGKHKGVAPGASLYAVKVCSAVATSCSGVAILQGIDYALDPNDDGNIGDAVDVINMSLGSDYGQEEDDSSAAVANAVKLGVVVVVSAGNGSNHPYIVGSPSTAEAAISVAQTTVPGELGYPLKVNTPPAIAGLYPNTATVDWAPIGSGVSGTVAAVGRGCPAGSVSAGSPEDPWTASPAGKVALIDRGGCSVSLKVDRAAKAGAIGVLIGLVAPGDAVSFSNGGGTTFVPTLVIQQSLSLALKANPGATVTLSPANSVALVGSMASTSSRGVSIPGSKIKPEIGAPGASISAIAGSGNGQEAFGGTSGAAPMVSGAAAILVQAYPHFAPQQIKALLMNTAETTIYTNPALLPGELAPISRIGAGELRVDRALAVTTLVRNRADKSAALSFGFHEASEPLLLEKTLLLENFGNVDKTFSVKPSFRYANDEARKAVRVIAPSKVWVPAKGKQEISVMLFVDPKRLADWPFLPSTIGDGAVLNGPEYDGYLTFTSGSEKLSVPWHVLPRKASDVSVASRSVKAGKPIKLRNGGAGDSEFDVFALTGTSPRAPRDELPQAGDSFAFVDLRAVGVRVVEGEYLQFAINTFKRRAHPAYPAEFDIYVDTNGDGTDDYVIYNSEQGGFGQSGISLVNVVNLATNAASAYFYDDADLQSANAIFTVPLAALKATPATKLTFSVYAYDNYFTGNGTDAIGPMTFTPSKPKYSADIESATLPSGRSGEIGTTKVAGGAAASPSQEGLLLMLRREQGREARIIDLKP